MDRQIKEEIDFYNKEKINAVADRLLGRPYVFIKDFIYHLRCIERYGKHDVRYWWHYYFYRKLSYKLGFQIPPHTVAVGMKIYHFGTIIINSEAYIGRNCTIYPGVTVGKTNKGVPVIGDNCFLGLGCKIFGYIRIGDNVKVLPNAVVTKDVPDNCVVAGVPARIIMKNNVNDSQ